MIKVKYEKYYNNHINSYETKTFNSLESLADWLFGLVDAFDGDYKKRMHLDNNCIKSMDEHWFTHWVEFIEKDGVIIYSTGKFTNGISHLNNEIKQWLIACKERMENPVFNFG